jgi:hypothetical protein
MGQFPANAQSQGKVSNMVNFSLSSSRPVLPLVGLLIVAGAGAYYYYVYLPDTESAPAKVVQSPVKSPITAKKPQIAKPSSTQTQPTASAVPAALVASKPVAAPVQLVSTPPQMITPEQKPEKVQPEQGVKKPLPKKPKVKSRPVSPSKASAPSILPKSQPISSPVPMVLPEPVMNATEPIINPPKYNDMLTAALRGDSDAVRQLLDLGRWVDKPGDSGLTPLMAGIINRDVKMVQLLLDHGAEPTVQALDLARKNKDAAIVTLLEQYNER